MNAQLNDCEWCNTPDCNSNDCKLLNGQATPLTLAKGVACCEAACINRIPYPFDQSRGMVASLVRVTHHWLRVQALCVGDSWVLAG